jgi:hypothetical protein
MRSVVVHGVLLVFALGLAWIVWTREEEGTDRTEAAEEEEASVVVWDLAADAVQEIAFQSEKRRVTVKVSGRGDARGFDVSTYRKDERRRPRRADAGPADAGARDGGPARDAGPPADAGPEIEIVETNKAFAGNAQLAEYLGKIAPLRAKRSFGSIDRRTTEEFELDEPRGSIVVKAGGRTYTLDVGGSTFGSSDAYVRDRRTRKVYLVGSAVVRDLEFGETRFMQRDLVRKEKKEIAKVVVSHAGKRRTIVQRNREEERNASWTDERSPTKNELYDNWMGRVLRLRALEYLPAGEEPRAEGESTPPVPVLTIEYFDDAGSLGRVEIVKIESDPAEFYARGDATRGWVKLSASLAEQVERDVETVLDGASAPAPSKATPEPD